MPEPSSVPQSLSEPVAPLAAAMHAGWDAARTTDAPVTDDMAPAQRLDVVAIMLVLAVRRRMARKGGQLAHPIEHQDSHTHAA